MDTNTVYWIWLQQVFGSGSSKPVQLWRKFSSVRAFYEEAPKLLSDSSVFSKAESRRASEISLSQCRKIMEKAQKLSMKLLTPESENFPTCLSQIDNPPAVLYYQGELPAVDDVPTVAIVGSRKACPNALTAARVLSEQLARAGTIVVSGGAVGIDSSAHLGALDAGGKTICLLAGSLDRPYPKTGEKMRRAIAENGAVISEYPPETDVQRWHFGIRNRLISGLSCGVLVAEASVKSGTMMTARHAVEQSRDVFTLLVDSWRENAEGVLQLLWDGAKPVSCAADILTEFKHRFPACQIPPREPLSQICQDKPLEQSENVTVSSSHLSHASKAREAAAEKEDIPKPLSSSAQKMYQALSREPITAEELSMKTGMHIQDIFRAATELELSGKIRSFSGRRYAKRS